METRILFRLETNPDGRLVARSADKRLIVEAEDLGALREKLDLAVEAVYGGPKRVALLVSGQRAG